MQPEGDGAARPPWSLRIRRLSSQQQGAGVGSVAATQLMADGMRVHIPCKKIPPTEDEFELGVKVTRRCGD